MRHGYANFHKPVRIYTVNTLYMIYCSFRPLVHTQLRLKGHRHDVSTYLSESVNPVGVVKSAYTLYAAQLESARATEGGEKERLTAWNIISAKLLSQCPNLECTSTVKAVHYTHGKLAIGNS